MARTKADARWVWLANRLWGNSLNGWRSLPEGPKSDRTLLDRRIRLGHVETDEYGLIRITPAGRQALE